MWGGSGDARDGPSAVLDVQLHFGGAAGTRGSSVACAAGDGGCGAGAVGAGLRSEEHTSELQSHLNLVCRLLLEKKNSALLANAGCSQASGAALTAAWMLR